MLVLSSNRGHILEGTKMRKFLKIFALCCVIALAFAIADAPIARGAPAPAKTTIESSAIYFAQLVPAVVQQDIAAPFLLGKISVVTKDVLASLKERAGVVIAPATLNTAQHYMIVVPTLPAFNGEIIVVSCGSSITQPEITGIARVCDVQEVVATGIEKVSVFGRRLYGFAKEAMITAHAEILGVVETARSSLTIRV